MYATFQMMSQIHKISKEAKLLKQDWTNACAQRYLRILGEGMIYTIDETSPIACTEEYVRDVDWFLEGRTNDEAFQQTLIRNNEKIVKEIIENYTESNDQGDNSNTIKTGIQAINEKFPI
jgi:hypothetical protein